MNKTCPNCGHNFDDAELDSTYREGFEQRNPTWILDQAIQCVSCEIVLGRSLSNDPTMASDWEFHHADSLANLGDVTEHELEDAKSKLKKYPAMCNQFVSFLARRKAGDRTIRYETGNKTALAIIRVNGVVATFSTLMDL